MFAQTARASASLARRAKSLAVRVAELLGHVNEEEAHIRVEGRGVRGLRFRLKSVNETDLTGVIEAEDGRTENISLLALEYAPVSEGWKVAKANAAARAALKGDEKGSAADPRVAQILAVLRGGEDGQTTEETPLPPDLAERSEALGIYLNDQEQPSPLTAEEGKRNRKR